MKNEDGLKNKREADRRLALLSLAADCGMQKQQECLTSTEMSDFLEDRCTAQQRQASLIHFSSCESCYREWLELQQELSEDAIPQKKTLLFQRKIFTISGSFLALAASVVLYLNLNQNPGSQLQEPGILAQPQFETTKSDQTEKMSARQNRANGVVAKRALKKIQSQTSKTVSGGEVGRNSNKATLSDSALSYELPSDPVQEWLHEVIESCSSSTKSAEKWKILTQQGEELSFVEQPADVLKIQKYVQQIAYGQEQKTLCVEIIRIGRKEEL